MDAHHATHDRQTHRQTERVRDEEEQRQRARVDARGRRVIARDEQTRRRRLQRLMQQGTWTVDHDSTHQHIILRISSSVDALGCSFSLSCLPWIQRQRLLIPPPLIPSLAIALSLPRSFLPPFTLPLIPIPSAADFSCASGPRLSTPRLPLHHLLPDSRCRLSL